MRITRKIEIDAGHRVPGHKNAEGKPGACSSPHGHRYVIEATVDGTVPADGMVLDLGIVKQVMMDTIHRKADHAMLVWAGDDELFYALDGHDWKVCVLDDPPTAENLAVWFADLIMDPLADYGVALVAMRVYETPNAWADWEAQ